ncbi:MAG: sulfatase-like hydrolase/transferase [Planctomycetota bacterium]|nr:sulfatase-like hydrolase/transferase [Planctomycetota bacterium]
MPERPNILIVLSDQHNRSFMGCAGEPIVRTPNLDRFAAEGLRFTDAYCPGPLCCPSRMSFMTSRYPSGNRVWGNSQILSSGIPTWAHALGAAGYETALLGRMHFNGSDQRHGFERRPIGEYSARHPGAPEVGGPRWTKFSSASSGQSRACVEVNGHGTTAYQLFDDQVTAAACRYLHEQGRAKARRPFAAVVGWVLPHCPFICPRELFEYYAERIEAPALSEAERAALPPSIRRFQELRGIHDPLPERTIRNARAAYYGLCEYLDRNFGLLLEALEASGLSEDTLVLYTSDHGEMAGEHGCWWKSNYYEGSAGVPLLARGPGVPQGATCEAVCNLVDLGPTCIDVGGGAPLPHAAGRSLRGFLEGRAPVNWVDETFSEFVGAKHDPPSCMIRQGRWKLWTYQGDAQPALFDLESDPAELKDLGGAPEYAEIRAKLLKRIGEVWDGEAVARENARAQAEVRVIEAWGRAVAPPHEDTLPVPPPEMEKDIVLL